MGKKPKRLKGLKSPTQRNQSFPLETEETQTSAENEVQVEQGSEWDDAIVLASQLAIKRVGFSYNAYHSMNPGIDAVGNVLRTLREKKRSELLKAKHQRITETVENTKANSFRLFIENRFKETEIRGLTTEKELCGKAIILAWLNEDVSFFKSLAAAATIAFGVRRKVVEERQIDKDMTKMELLIRTAIALWHDDFCNPSRERVMAALKSNGVIIRPKDESKYFKMCKLGFLKSENGPGRPASKNAVIKTQGKRPIKADDECANFGQPPPKD
ncbi:MAG: hypothetical protein ACYC67_22445 [Prosthecobacter sp.]